MVNLKHIRVNQSLSSRLRAYGCADIVILRLDWSLANTDLAAAPKEADGSVRRLEQNLPTESSLATNRISNGYQIRNKRIPTKEITPSNSQKPTTPPTKQPKTPFQHSPSKQPSPNPPYHPHNPHAPHSNNISHAARSPTRWNCTRPCMASGSSTAITLHCSSSAARRSCRCADWLVGRAAPWYNPLRRRLVRGTCRASSSIRRAG